VAKIKSTFTELTSFESSFLVKFQACTLDESHHLLVKLPCKTLVKILMISVQNLHYAFCSQNWSWSRTHRGRHYDCAFCIYTLLMYTNTRAIEAE